MKLLGYILTYPLFLLSHYIPKNNNIWVFGSWGGRSYNDNSKYLFQYVNERNSCKAYWLTKNRILIKKLRAEKLPCHHMYSLKGILLALRAGAAVLSRTKSEDLPIYLSPRKTKIIQLWHGTPLKKLGRDSNSYRKESLIKNLLRKSLFPHAGNQCETFIVSSKDVAKIIESAYGNIIGKSGIKVTGYPRNDALFREWESKEESESLNIIYMPTFRDNSRNASDLFIDHGFECELIEKKLKYRNIYIDIKLHPEVNVDSRFIDIINKVDRIRLLECEDIYERLGEYQMLITDYSSIYFDYLVLERPVIFAPFDYEDYLSMRGMYFKYDEVSPGCKAYNWLEVIDCIYKNIDNPELYKQKVKELNELLNTYTDSDNCKRVTETIKEIVEG